MKTQSEYRIAGDPLPPTLAAYYDAADSGSADEAADRFAPNVLLALPPTGGHEVDPRRIVRGREAGRDWLRRRDHTKTRHQTLVCVSDGPICMLEGLLRSREDDRPLATYVAGFRLGPEGIERYLAFSTTPVPMAPRVDERTPGDARAAVDRYFHALDAGDFEGAAEQFSADTMYCHPPYRHTNITDNQRVTFNGREELLANFRRRGKTEFTHRVLEFIQRGPNGLFELVVENLPDGGTGGAICSLGLDDDGLINRYVAVYTEPAAPRQ